MSSNVLKGSNISLSSKDKITINSNAFVEKRLEELMQQIREEPLGEVGDSFSEGLDPLTVDDLLCDPSESGFTSGIITRDDINRITVDAQAHADEIVEKAEEEAEAIREEARDAGYQDGYHEGEAAARAKLEEDYAAREAQLKKQYDERTRALEREYQERRNELEPLLVAKLSEIFAAVTSVRMEQDEKVIGYLLNRALSSVDNTRDYMIHVSITDYEAVKQRKEEIVKGTGILPEHIEIVEDGSLGAGGCLIESDGGIWDCSLGTQLKLLVQQLKLLSYQPSE